MAIPVFKILNLKKALNFYVDWLGFKVDWQHLDIDNYPVYVQISLGPNILHLSENKSFNFQETKAILEIEGVQRYHSQLLDRPHAFSKPTLKRSPWNTITMELVDPFNNQLIFSEKSSAGYVGQEKEAFLRV